MKRTLKYALITSGIIISLLPSAWGTVEVVKMRGHTGSQGFSNKQRIIGFTVSNAAYHKFTNQYPMWAIDKAKEAGRKALAGSIVTVYSVKEVDDMVRPLIARIETLERDIITRLDEIEKGATYQ